MNKKVSGLRILLFTVITLATSSLISFGAFAGNQSTLTDEEKITYSLNDIMFYQKCPTSSGSSSSGICGTNKNYAGEQVFTDEQLKAIEANQPFYEKAASQYGIPWQLIAVIHKREHGLQRSNPSNGQGVYQFASAARRNACSGGNFTAGKISDEQFQIQTNCAAEAIKNSYGSGLDLNTDDGVKKMFFKYNGMAQAYIDQALRLGFSQKEAENGEGSPYVMNRYDEKREPSSTWGQIKTDGGSIEYPANNDFGAFVYYKALVCDGSTVNPNDSAGNNDSSDSVYTPTSTSSTTSPDSGSNAQKIAETALKIAWPKGSSESDYNRNKGGKPTEAMAEAWKSLDTYNSNIKHGPDCGYFVQTVIAASGVDSNYTNETKGSPVLKIDDYAEKHSDKWEVINFDDADSSKLQSGDIVMAWGGGGTGFHTWIVADVDGELREIEASYTNKLWGRVSNKIGKTDRFGDKQIIIRAKGGASCNACEPGSMNINATGACLAWPLGTDPEKYTLKSGKVLESILTSPGATDEFAGTGAPTKMAQKAWVESGMSKNSMIEDTFDGNIYSWRYGAYCCGFTAMVARYSGVDKNFNGALSTGGYEQVRYAEKHSDIWDVHKWNGEKSDLQGGDILVSSTHSWMVVQDEKGEMYRAEAGLTSHKFGRIEEYSGASGLVYVIRAKNAKNSNVGVSVTDGVKTSSTTGKLTSGTGQNNGDINATAFALAWPEGTPENTYKTTPWEKWVEAYDSLPGRKNTKNANNWEDGRSCMVFVNIVLQYAGDRAVLDDDDIAERYKKGTSVTASLIKSDEWEEVGGEGSVGITFGDLKPGDVLSYFNNGEASDGSTYYKGLGLKHEAIYGENSAGKGRIIQADKLIAYGHVLGAKGKNSKLTGWAPIVRVFRWKKQKGDSGCDICAGEDDDSGNGQLKEGGYSSVEEAKGIIGEYHKTWKNDKPHFGDVCDHGGFSGSPHANCTNFSMWFAYHYMGCTDLAGKGVMGYSVADKVYSVCKGKFNKITKSNTPSVYSVVSWNSPVGKMMSSNHTAVVIGINKAKDQIIFADAAWCSSDGRIWEDKLSRYEGHGTYVDISDYVTGLKT